ncbi:MAG: metallophosphoesterase family protein [Bacteroidota bacterium]|nr:metallophosphoesterase family protein [Bacteroidota bacterium]
MHKRWVIPDIHGCINTLKALMEEKICPAHEDELFFLGDYIDRGPGSRGVIDYIRNLQKDQYKIVALKGNHEDFISEIFNLRHSSMSRLLPRFMNPQLNEWMNIGGRKTLESFGVKNIQDIPAEYIEWMKGLPCFASLDDYVLVHAGLNFSLDDPFSDQSSMLWVRDYNIKPEKIGNRRIIHGHVPVHLELIHFAVTNPNYPYIDLDNGTYIRGKDGFGNLVALELNSMQMVIQDNRDYSI